jgi:cephalosporin-C deacetylase
VSVAPRIAFASGPECLGVTVLSAYGVADWQRHLGDEVILEAINLGSLEGLSRLWTYQGLIMMSDGCYDEAAGALTLSTVFEWCRRGGVLATVGISPFLAARRANGEVRASSCVAIDVSETFIGDNRKEAALLVTDLGPSFPETRFLPRTLVGLNHGAVFPLALYAIQPIDEPLVVTEHGDTVIGARHVEDGWWISWAAAARPQYREVIMTLTSRLLHRHLPRAAPDRAEVVLDQLSHAEGDDEVVTVHARGANRIIRLVDEDTSEAWEAKTDLDAAAKYRLPSTGQVRSLGASVEGSRVEFKVVYPSTHSLEGVPLAPVEPPGFDEFWDDRLSELNEHRVEVARTPFPEFSSDSVAAYRIRFSGWLGETVTGVLTRPRLATRGSLLTFPGYMAAGLTGHPWPLAEDYAILSIDVRRVGSISGELPTEAEGMLTHQLETPARSGIVGAIMDGVRAFDVLSSMSEFAEGNVGLYGSSQGGALALAVAAMRKSAKAVVSAAPFLMNIRGEYSHVSTEPYLELQRYANRGEPEQRTALDALSFVDSAHFLRRVRQSALVVIARDDDVAPARGIETWGLNGNIDLRVVSGDHITPAFAEMRSQIYDWLGRHIVASSDHGSNDHARGGC